MSQDVSGISAELIADTIRRFQERCPVELNEDTAREFAMRWTGILEVASDFARSLYEKEQT